MKKLIILISLFFFASFVQSFCDDFIVIEGKILDEQSNTGVAGSRISVKNTNRGTYSAANGFFKIKIKSDDVLIISSIGYELREVSKFDIKPVIINLKPSPVVTKSVNVTANITAEQIIERAIRKKNENVAKTKTFQGQLYSKLMMEMDGSIIASTSAKNGTISMSTNLGGSSENSPFRYLIMETVSEISKDYDKKINHVNIINRRQTSNMQPDDNILAITEFFSFYDDNIKFMNTNLPSPIGIDALDDYNFKLLERQYYGDRFIYLLEVEPKTKVFPGFYGTIKILEGDYSLIEAELKPSESTSIPFFENIKIKQVYNSTNDSLWYPGLLEVEATAKLDVIKGLLDFKSNVKATSIFSDAKINIQLPDSIYNQEKNRIITVSENADEYNSEYWEENSLRELSVKEKEIYTYIDSVYKRDTSVANNAQYSDEVFDLNLIPYFEFNRVGAVCLGTTPSITIFGSELAFTGIYSFGQEKWYGNIKIDALDFYFSGLSLKLNSNIFSKISKIGWDNSYPKIYNTISGLIAHSDYNDYSFKEGFDIGLESEYKDIQLNLNYENSRQYSINKTTNNSIFEKRIWRNNPKIDEGNYSIFSASLNLGKVNYIVPVSGVDAELNISAFSGNNLDSKINFSGIFSKLYLQVPTFYTGYNPMTLNLVISGGISDDNLPVQYQYKMATRLFVINKNGNFLTAPISFYGGNKYFTVDASYNLTDILWRWIGLPVYEGRGIDLIISGAYGKYYNNTGSFYKETTDDGYSEIGFGLSRIPTFLSNIGYLSFDFRFGIGPVAAGRTGGAVSVSLPF